MPQVNRDLHSNSEKVNYLRICSNSKWHLLLAGNAQIYIQSMVIFFNHSYSHSVWAAQAVDVNCLLRFFPYLYHYIPGQWWQHYVSHPALQFRETETVLDLTTLSVLRIYCVCGIRMKCKCGALDAGGIIFRQVPHKCKQVHRLGSRSGILMMVGHKLFNW